MLVSLSDEKMQLIAGIFKSQLYPDFYGFLLKTLKGGQGAHRKEFLHNVYIKHMRITFNLRGLLQEV